MLHTSRTSILIGAGTLVIVVTMMIVAKIVILKEATTVNNMTFHHSPLPLSLMQPPSLLSRVELAHLLNLSNLG